MPYRKLHPMRKFKKRSWTKIKNSWQAGWYTVGGREIYFRSGWEYKYALYLEFLKAHGEIYEWYFEEDTFWFENIKRGVRSYTPDFKVYTSPEKFEYHEVKGWMDDRSKTKLKRMAKYHPKIKMVLKDSEWFKKNKASLEIAAKMV